ncbi:hypothetical protein OPV22_030689 [Ensete ventricosum]|uniref:DUF630 domain-containing protein n=1 Tax=Ensete ventricosum TaxID=4639 RepID=A0AAV8P6A9_ENSVE|nr:hypothetical protein OPV22_030689 [Ensete ventricosum]
MSSSQSSSAAGIASGRPVAKCRFAEFRQARALLQQALRVAVPSPSADLQNSGRREHFCSRHCEWPSRRQVQMSATSAAARRYAAGWLTD